jgi:hypothetical protein
MTTVVSCTTIPLRSPAGGLPAVLPRYCVYMPYSLRRQGVCQQAALCAGFGKGMQGKDARAVPPTYLSSPHRAKARAALNHTTQLTACQGQSVRIPDNMSAAVVSTVCHLRVTAAREHRIQELIPVNRTTPLWRVTFPAPPEIKVVLGRVCYDCHSHEAVWPFSGTGIPGRIVDSAPSHWRQPGGGRFCRLQWRSPHRVYTASDKMPTAVTLCHTITPRHWHNLPAPLLPGDRIALCS